MNRVSRVLAACVAVLVLAVPGLEAGTVGTSGDEDVECPSSLSHVGTAVREALAAYGSGHSELTTCNQVPAEWLHYLPVGEAIHRYFGHVGDEIADTNRQIEIAMLGGDAVRMGHIAYGIQRLHERFAGTGLRPLVRIMTGTASADDVYDLAVRYLPQGEPWNVQVMAMQIGDQDVYDPWNHSKMAVRDRCVALSGSVETNSESEMYMEVHGEAAAAAHRYYESVWATFPDHWPYGDCVASNRLYCSSSCIERRCWESSLPPASRCSVSPTGTATVFSLGRGAFGAAAGWDLSSDVAVFAALEAATEEIVILQRSLELRPTSPNYVLRLYRTLAEAAYRGVQVRILVGGASPPYHPPIEEIIENLGDVMEEVFDDLGLPPAARRAAHRNVQIGQVKTHAKVYMVDRQAFYVGSQNLYPTGLQDPENLPVFGLYEQGFLVDDAGLAGEMAEQLEVLWQEVDSYLWSPYAFDGTYDVLLGAEGSGPPGSGWCLADFTIEVVRGTIQPPGSFQCNGEFNGDPIVVTGWLNGQFDVSAAGTGLVYGEIPPFYDTAVWTGEAAGSYVSGEFSGLELGVSYSGSFLGTYQP